MRVSRRDFLVGAGITALAGFAAARWLRDAGLVGRVPLWYYELVGNADEGTGRAVMQGLVRTILPLDDAHFPVLGIERIERRVYALFHLEHNELFHKSLALFNRLDLYPSISDLPFSWRTSAHDSQLYDEFKATVSRRGYKFAELPIAEQRSYLRMWARSSFAIKRRFYQSMKAVIMAAAYSLPETWPVIGYDGPLLRKRRRRTIT